MFTSAANPKVAPPMPRVPLSTSGSKQHHNHRVASVLRFRSSLRSVRQTRANFGIGTLARKKAITGRPRGARRYRGVFMPGAAARDRLFHFVMVKPTHYDDDGYPRSE